MKETFTLKEGKYINSLALVPNMLTLKQLQLFGIFAKQPFQGHSFSELKETSGERSNSVLQQAIAKFKAENLVREQQIGPTKLFYLNFEEGSVYNYLELAVKSLLKAKERDLGIVQEHLGQQMPFYVLVIFGSHAAGTQTPTSDLDVAIIIPDQADKHTAEAALHSAGNKTMTPLDSHVMTEKEFLEMLAADYENLGKEIARKHLAVRGSSTFYKLLQRAQAHGWGHETLLRTSRK